MMYEGDTRIPDLLRQVRLMKRFFDEVVDQEPFREHYVQLHCAYMDLLNAEFAPHALDFACAIVEWEDWATEHKVR